MASKTAQTVWAALITEALDNETVHFMSTAEYLTDSSAPPSQSIAMRPASTARQIGTLLLKSSQTVQKWH